MDVYTKLGEWSP